MYYILFNLVPKLTNMYSINCLMAVFISFGTPVRKISVKQVPTIE